VLSVHSVRRYKTDPAAYALGPQALKLPARQILFVSSNGWDAIGATWFGYTTLWVNRHGLPLEQLDTEPTRIGTSLRDVLDFSEPSERNHHEHSLPQGMQINGPILPGFETILTLPALELVAQLHRAFQPRRKELLAGARRSAPSGWTPASVRTSCPRRRPSARATGRSRRFPRRCTAGAWRSPARSTRRWSSTRSTRARTAT
jgi:hypothetical protein